MIAITNFWDLEDKNPEAFDAIYRAMAGDAYTRSSIEEALSIDEDEPDMSDYTYYPAITEQQAKYIEELTGAKLQRATVKKRPEMPKLYELTHTSSHPEL